METLDEAAEAARRTASRSCPGTAWAWPEKEELAAQGFSVRCLQAAGRSASPTGEDESGLVAVVARAY